MLTYMLDTNICIYVMKNYPQALRKKFNSLAEQLCISSITLGELHYDAEKSARRADNLTAIEHFVARLDVLPFEAKAAAQLAENLLRPAAHRDDGVTDVERDRLGAVGRLGEVVDDHDDVLAVAARERSAPQDVEVIGRGDLQILELILDGCNNQEISTTTGLSLGTVKNYVSAILLALDVESRSHLISLFH